MIEHKAYMANIFRIDNQKSRLSVVFDETFSIDEINGINFAGGWVIAHSTNSYGCMERTLFFIYKNIDQLMVDIMIFK